MTMNSKIFIVIASLFCFTALINSFPDAQAQQKSEQDRGVVKLENPVNVQYIKARLKKSHPRLILTPRIEANLKAKIKSDPVVKSYYEAMKYNAKEILTKPVLTRVVIGRRMLSTSREMLYRMSILSLLYRLDRDPAYLKKIDEELKSVCNFVDWHPSHFLDVAEMSLAVSLAVDWAGFALPKSTVDMAKRSLIEKGLNPSFKYGNYTGTNNWNQVCNCGMIAAAITIADRDPELAASVISKSLDGMPNALKQYAPSGIYPEGATYWDYGTSFSCVTSSMLQSAFGTDFGIANYPAFIESAYFRMLMVAPSNYYFNFADCGDRQGESGDITLAWFAQKTGNAAFLEKEKFLKPPEKVGKLSRLAGPGLIWLSQFEEKTKTELPLIWKGDGPNPVVVFRGGKDDPYGYYFGGKGGRANLSHGNMDAGSFIFELNGVRWVIDPGNQDYNELEQAGFDLWNQTQNSQRWSLITKGNHGHSTLTVNDERFKVDATAPIVEFVKGPVPQATVDMTGLYMGNLKKALRKFIKDTDHSVVIEDHIELSDSTRSLIWAVMTTAEVVLTDYGVLLKKDGKSLELRIISPSDIKASVLMLDPPPTIFDKKIAGLKRVELRIPAYIFKDKKGLIKVRLTAPESQ